MDELKEWINNNLIGFSGRINSKILEQDNLWFQKYNCLDKYNKIISLTKFLPSNVHLSQRIWHITNNLLKPNKCFNLNCSNSTCFITYRRGYHKYCCCLCAQSNKETKNKIIQTNLKKYGCKYGVQNEEIKRKIVKKCLEKFGVDNVSKLNNISEKKKQTCLKNYGVKWILQDVNRIQNGIIKKYGVNNIQKCPEIRKQTILTRREIFYDKLFSTPRLKGLIIPLFTKDEYVNSGYYEKHKFKCIKCNTIFDGYLVDGDVPRCTKCYELPLPKGRSFFLRPIL